MCPFVRYWHYCYGGTKLLSDWIWGLLHRKESMPGTIILVKNLHWGISWAEGGTKHCCLAISSKYLCLWLWTNAAFSLHQRSCSFQWTVVNMLAYKMLRISYGWVHSYKQTFVSLPRRLTEHCRREAGKNVRTGRNEEGLWNAIFWARYSHWNHNPTAAVGACTQSAEDSKACVEEELGEHYSLLDWRVGIIAFCCIPTGVPIRFQWVVSSNSNTVSPG